MGKPNPLCKPVASPYLVYTTPYVTTTTTVQPYNDDEDFRVIIIPTSGVQCGAVTRTTTTSTTANVLLPRWYCALPYIAGTSNCNTSNPQPVFVTPAFLTSNYCGSVDPQYPNDIYINDDNTRINFSLACYGAATFTTTTTTLAPIPLTLSYYPFENNTNDANGLYNPTSSLNITFTTGRIGSFAADFNGTSSQIVLPNMIQNNFTISFWVKTTQTSAVTGFGGQFYQGQSFLNGEVGGISTDFGVSYLNNKIAFGVGNPDTTMFSNSTINTGSWTHVACTRNNSTGLMQVYIDGALENSITGPTGPRTATSSLYIGPNFIGGIGFVGQMDQLRIYNTVLSPSDIFNLSLET